MTTQAHDHADFQAWKADTDARIVLRQAGEIKELKARIRQLEQQCLTQTQLVDLAVIERNSAKATLKQAHARNHELDAQVEQWRARFHTLDAKRKELDTKLAKQGQRAERAETKLQEARRYLQLLALTPAATHVCDSCSSEVRGDVRGAS